MQYSAVIFDLDGTLLDTLADIASSVNQVLSDNNYPTHAIAEYKNFVGEGVAVLFSRVLPPDQINDAAVMRCVEQFREVYADHWNVFTQPYDGILELLDLIEGREMKTAVLSNKPHDFTVNCVDEYLSEHPFELVLGQRENVPRKPDPSAAIEICEHLDMAPKTVLYLGDTAIDMQTAHSAGMFSVGALWGFRPEAELRAAGAGALLNNPRELFKMLD